MEHPNILLSIIVPCYNIEKYISDCLQSFVAIKTPKEIICVDDGSTDATFSILLEFSKKYSFIKVLTQKNFGVSCARNNALNHIVGKYVMFVDGDDAVNAQTIDYVVDTLIKYDIDAGMFSFKEIAEEDYYENFIEKLQDVKCSINNNFSEVCVSSNVCWKIIKTSIIRDNEIKFPCMKYSEDGYFWANVCVYLKSAIRIDRPGYFYRKRANSAIHSGKRNLIADSLLLLAVFEKGLIDRVSQKANKKVLTKMLSLSVLYYMTFSISCNQYSACDVIRKLKENGLFPFKPNFYLLHISFDIKKTFINFSRFLFFIKYYYYFYYKVVRLIKEKHQ